MTTEQPTPIQRSSSHLVDLSRSECEERLGQHVVGRVGFCGAAGPVIVPVNYRMANGQVVFRTSPYGMLAPLQRRTAVAFEVDGIDESAATGWDVLARGFAEAVTNDHSLAQLWQSGPVPWARGVRNLFIAITVEELTGRMVRGPFVD